MNEFERMLNTISNPSASEAARRAFVQSFKHFALSYICGLQGCVDTLSDSDPIRQLSQTALDEITTTLMDR